jgi:hypothetical protein
MKGGSSRTGHGSHCGTVPWYSACAELGFDGELKRSICPRPDVGHWYACSSMESARSAAHGACSLRYGAHLASVWTAHAYTLGLEQFIAPSAVARVCTMQLLVILANLLAQHIDSPCIM